MTKNTIKHEKTTITAEDPIYHKIAWRLLPIIFLCYMVSIIDRVNIGFAKLQMANDLGLSAAAYGFGAGIFFLVYCLFEIPSNVILSRMGARIWICRIMVSWGLITMATALIQTPTQFYIMRVLLGIAEAGLYPGIVYFLSQWFPQGRQARVLALLVIGGPVAGIVVGPLSGWIMEVLPGAFGLKGWQWLFLIEGLPALVLGIAFFFMMDNSPSEASWLTTSEKENVMQHLATEKSESNNLSNWRAAFSSPSVWIISLIMALIYLGIYAMIFWIPTMLKGAGAVGMLNIGWISSIPHIAAIIALPLLARSSDYRGERHWHIFLCASAGAAGLAISVLYPDNIMLAVFGLTIATASIVAVVPLVWALANGLVMAAAAAVGIALINTIASLGSFFGPYITGLGYDMTGSFEAPLLLIAGLIIVAGLLVFLVPDPQPNRSTRRRDRNQYHTT